jgi:hypothetical protein
MPLISALRRQRQRISINLRPDSRVSSKTAKATQRNPIQKNQKGKKEKENERKREREREREKERNPKVNECREKVSPVLMDTPCLPLCSSPGMLPLCLPASPEGRREWKMFTWLGSQLTPASEVIFLPKLGFVSVPLCFTPS